MNKAQKAQHKKQLKLAGYVYAAMQVSNETVLDIVPEASVGMCAHCAGYAGICGTDLATWTHNGVKYAVTDLGHIYVDEKLIERVDF